MFFCLPGDHGVPSCTAAVATGPPLPMVRFPTSGVLFYFDKCCCRPVWGDRCRRSKMEIQLMCDAGIGEE